MRLSKLSALAGLTLSSAQTIRFRTSTPSLFPPSNRR